MPEFELIRPDNPDAVRQSARHTLFVEGDTNSIDQLALEHLLRDTSIRVEGLGPCYHISSAAEALSTYHPDYYFLVDRDTYSDQEVEDSWANFPDPSKNNLLIWRRKEIENYFLIPAYAEKSEFFKGTEDEFVTRLQAEASKRVFFDAANQVISQVRGRLQRNWINHFGGTSGFETLDKARQRLLQRPEFRRKLADDGELLDETILAHLFDDHIDLLLDGAATCEYGRGKWLELMGGKKLLNTLVVHSFDVRDRRNRPVYGQPQVEEVIKSLILLPDPQLPPDFVELKALIIKRIDETL